MNKKISLDSFQNWIPFNIYGKDRETYIDWCYMGDARFTEPFFEMTVGKQKRNSPDDSPVKQTSLDYLRRLSENLPQVAPTGFIFHLSRCGSTLISQMFAALTKNIVISEAPPIDSIIRGQCRKPELSRDERINNLRFLINILGQKRFAGERHLLVKFDCWHTLDVSLIDAAFPNVPRIFLYRNPIEIIVSHLRRRGMQMMPGAIENLLPGFDFDEILQMSAEEYIARVLGRICQSALEFANHPYTLLINYKQLPEACLSTISRHFKINYNARDIEKMKAAAQFDAKTPQLFFAPDVENKLAAADETVRLAAAEFVEPYYSELEKIRLKSDD